MSEELALAVIAAARAFVSSEEHGFSRLFDEDPYWTDLRKAVRELDSALVREQIKDLDISVKADVSDECTCSPIKQEYCHVQGCKGGSMLGEFGIKRQPAPCYTCGLTGKHDEECSAARRKEPDAYEVPVKQLVTGDSVYSPSSDSWHEVRRSTAGQLYFLRDERWMPVDFAADVRFLTRRGDSGAAAGALFDAFGGEVIEG